MPVPRALSTGALSCDSAVTRRLTHQTSSAGVHVVPIDVCRALAPLIAVLATGCDATTNGAVDRAGTMAHGHAVPPGESRSQSSAPTIHPWDARGCGDDDYRNARLERHPALIGRSADELLAAYGKPHLNAVFRAGEGVGTYSGGVAGQLPEGGRQNAATPVREIV